MSTWNYIVLGISLVLLALLVRKEVTRGNRPRRMARVIASVMGVGALACLMLPLTYMRRIAVGAGGREGILLTEGYDKDSVRQFMQDHPEGEVWDWPSGTMVGLSKLHVFGYGLTREQWDHAERLEKCAGSPLPPLVFHPSVAGAGVTEVYWKQKLAPGERLQVQGRFFYGTIGQKVKLVLTGMGTTLDSLEKSPGGKVDFELAAVPAQVGRAVYHLVAVAGADTLEREDIPVEVVPGKALKILLLASSPDFENTFLMNWLSKNGHGVARRTMISRGKYDKAFVNIPEEALTPLTPSLLEPFDLVIADASVLSSFGAGELSALRREVGEKGLGLILKVDGAGKGETGIGGAGTAGIGGAGTIEIAMVKDSSQRLYIKEKPGLQALMRDSLSRITVGTGLYGSGKIVFSTLNTTYSQVLSGGGQQYAAYWSEVLRKAAREGAPGEEWRIETDLPVVGEPVVVRLQTTKAGLPQGYCSGRSVYLAQDMQLPFNWRGVYWPEEAGWQFVRSLQGDTCWWYAWPAGGWANLHRRERWKATLQYMDEKAMSTGEARSDGAEKAGRVNDAGVERALISKGWFYVVFLLCVLYLWVERKMEWMNGRIVR